MVGHDAVASTHGGRLIAASRAYPEAPGPWIDLSTGINPVPYPVPTLPAEAWTRLPEPEELWALQAAAGDAYGVRAEDVVAAPGTSALIALLPRIVGGPAAVLGPTYGEYVAAWPDALEVASLAELRRRPVRVVCRPNNPDGRVAPGPELVVLARDGVLVVDAAFADFRTDGSDSEMLYAGLQQSVVLRSFGKPYGLAGVRLGFALAEPTLAARLRHALGPWPVSGPAIAIGCAALRDRAWREGAGDRLRSDAARLDTLLQVAGLTIVGGTCLFRLVTCDAAAWHDHLARHGILTRRFEAQPHWLRFGLPPPWAWPRLEAALQSGEQLRREIALGE